MSPLTVTAERATLLRDVRRRAAPVLALAAARCWPEAELRVLTRFLRTTALRQVADEQLVPALGAGAGPAVQPDTEHEGLVELAHRLDRARAATCSLGELSGLVEETLRLLGERTGPASGLPNDRRHHR